MFTDKILEFNLEGRYYFTEEELKSIQAIPGYPCDIEMFKINGVIVDATDFGISVDTTDEYCNNNHTGCGNRVFKISEAVVPKELLEKYKINAPAYRQIQRTLEKLLTVGKCDYCD